MNGKKIIINREFISILRHIPSSSQLEAYKLLKPSIMCSTVKIENILTLLISKCICDRDVEFNFLNDFVVKLTDLDWNNIISLLESLNKNYCNIMRVFTLCIFQMNSLYKDTKKYVTVEQIGKILKQVSIYNEPEIYKLLKPFIHIPTNVQNLFKFIKFIPNDSQKIECAKISFDKIELLSNTDLHSILGSMQFDIFKVKFVKLFANKIEISNSNLFAINKLIPTEKMVIDDLFISKGLQLN